MYLYSRVLQILGWTNFLICMLFTIFGSIFPHKILGGTLLNEIGVIFMFIASFFMFVLIGVFCIKLGETNIDRLIVLNTRNIFIYVVCIVNLVYRLFFNNANAMENNYSVTSAKLMAGFAVGLLLNLSVITITTNYINSKQM